MRNCEQTKGQDLLEHGRSVREHYFALLDHLEGQVSLHGRDNWRLPAWVDQYAAELLADQPARHQMDRYLTLHDGGKWQVKVVSEDGRAHFPGHADASMRAYLDAAGEHADPLVAELIRTDMDAHLLKADGIEEFASRPTASGLLLAALAEIHSNAAMFGGIDSTSFKIKAKHLASKGRRVLEARFPAQS